MMNLDGSELAFGDELFAELEGEASINFDDLAAGDGPEFVREIVAYTKAHPRLEVRFVNKSSVLGDELLVRWKWRR